ncbi:hypothetical protein B0O99DRAFT_668161, partial [Bisporella sp. PMI_857]
LVSTWSLHFRVKNRSSPIWKSDPKPSLPASPRFSSIPSQILRREQEAAACPKKIHVSRKAKDSSSKDIWK